MNILILNHYAGSPEMGMEFRPYYFAREWIKMGHRVDIIAADYSHLRRVNPSITHDFEEQVIDGIHYHWVRTGRYEGNGAKRAITMFRFVSKLWVHTRKIISQISPDVVIASSTYPLDTYVGQRIRKLSKKKVKLIHEVHDMWPISPVELGGMSPRHPFIKVMQYAEDSFCKNSDLVVSLLPAADRYLCEHGMQPQNFRHVANGIVLEEWENPLPLPQELAISLTRLRQDGKFIVCFFGSINKWYALDYLVEAVKKVEQVCVVFIGNGTYKDELKQKTVQYKERFLFFTPISKKSIPSLFEKIDVSYVGAINQDILRFGISMNKLFDSMMGGKPLLYSCNAPNNYVEAYNCGVCAKVEDVADYISAINKLKNLSAAERENMGQNGKNAVIEHFNYKILSQNFERYLQE